jgi:hypothetical protein
MKATLAYFLIGTTLLFTACEKWYTTEDASHISYVPEFELAGGEFISLVKQDSAEFEEPGATAQANGESLTVFSAGTADLTKVGVYIIRYYAWNNDGIKNTVDRIIAVTNTDVTNNDLSGNYTGTLWDPVEAKVRKTDAKGLYESEDIMGFPGFPVTGKFVDLGNNELVLINGDGFFGRYAATEGTYTRSTLSWTISLLDNPYEGVELQVLWRKTD